MTDDLPPWPDADGQGIPRYILPYEEIPDDINPGGLAVLGEDVIAVGECDFRSAVLDTPLGILPVVYFHFRDGVHRPLMPIAMILDVEYMQRWKEELVRAMNDAIRKAKARGA